MPSIPSESFLRLVWTQNLYTSLEGENVAVVSPGKPNPAPGIDVLDASVEVNGVLLRGYDARIRGTGRRCQAQQRHQGAGRWLRQVPRA